MRAADRLRARRARDRFRGLRHALQTAARIHVAGDVGALSMALWGPYQPAIKRELHMASELWRRFGPPA